MKTTFPDEQTLLWHTHLDFISEITSRVPQGIDGEYISEIDPLRHQKKVCARTVLGMNESNNHKGVCRTALATPGLLKMVKFTDAKCCINI